MSEVTGTISSSKDAYYIINGKIKVTGNHVFILPDNSQKTVEDMKVGDILKTYTGQETIKTLEKIDQTVTVYDIEVRDYHLFYAENYLVHNSGCGGIVVSSITVNNNFTLTGAGSATVNVDTYDPNLIVNGNVSIGSGQTLISSATAAFYVKGNWTNSGTFTPGTGTVTFNGTATGKTINPGASSFYNLTFNGTGGAWSPLTNTVTVTNDLTMTNGTFDTSNGTANVTVNGNVACGVSCGTINMTSTNTFTQNITTNKNFGTSVAGTTAWAFNNLTFTSSSGWPTITTQTGGTGDITINGVLTIAYSVALDAGNRIWRLNGSGTPFLAGYKIGSTYYGTLSPNTSTFSFEETTGTIVIAPATYYNLQTNPASGTVTFTLGTAYSTYAQPCFLAGTQVLVNEGQSQNIEKLQIGDTVQSFDINNFQHVPSIVTDVFETRVNDYYLINNKVKATANHVFIMADYSQKPVAELKIGDVLATYTGTEVIQTIEHINQPTTVYDIEVEGYHLFYADGYLVHNGTIVDPVTVNNNFTLTGAGAGTVNVDTVDPVLTVNGNVSIGSGQTLIASVTAAFNVAGNWTNSGTFTPGTGTVTFNGATAQTITPGGSSFYNITHSGAGTLQLVTTDLHMDGAFLNSTGTFDANNRNMTFSGNWSNTGAAIFTRGSGTMTFDGTTALINSSSAAADLGALAISGGVTLGSNATITSVSGAGTLNLGTGSNTLTVSGNTSPLGVTTFNKGTGSTVKYTGTSATNVAAVAYNNLQLSGATIYSLAGNLTSGNALTGNVTIDNGATLSTSGSNYSIALAGNWVNSGTFTANQSTVTFGTGTHAISGATTFYNLATTLNSTVTFQSSVQQTITNGFSCAGTVGNTITINSSVPSTAATLSMGAGKTANCDYLRLSDSAAVGGALWNAGAHSTGISGDPSSGVTGWSTIPNSPISVTAIPSNASVSVSWVAPAITGNSTIISYTITSNPGAISTTTATATTTAVVTGLSNGTAYTFTVVANNAIGTSASSTASSGVTPATAPDAPTVLTPTYGNTQVSLSWTPPVWNGGATITDYVIDFKKTASSSSEWSTFADGISALSSATVIGLTNGTPYDFRVSAYNWAGQGNASTATSSTPKTVPDAPTTVTAVAGDSSATVSFNAPANNGGSTITGYTVTSSAGTDSNSGATTTSHLITGLTNGSTYTFTVTATNVVGVSVASTASAPLTIPLVPGDIAICGILATPGTYTLTANVGSSGQTCYTVTSAGVIITSTNTKTITGDISASGYDVDFSGRISIASNTVTASSTTFNNFAISSANNINVTHGAIFNNTSYNDGNVNGTTTFNGTSYNNKSVTGPAIFNTTYYDSSSSTPRVPVDGNFFINNPSGWFGSVSGTIYDSEEMPVTTFIFDNSINNGTVKVNARFNGTSYNLGTVLGDATFNTTYYSSIIPVGGEFNIGTGKFWSGNVVGAVFGSDDAEITRYILSGNSYNNGTINTDVTFNDTSYNNTGTVNGNVIFNNNTRNLGLISGTADVYSPVVKPLGGTVTGLITYYSYPAFYFNDVVSGTNDGDWDNPDNWFTSATFATSTGSVPSFGNDVFIYSNLSQNSTTTTATAQSATFESGSINSISITTANGATFLGTSVNNGTITNDATFQEDASNNTGTVSGVLTRLYTISVSTSRDFTQNGGYWIIIAQNAVVDLTTATYNIASNIFKALGNGLFTSNPGNSGGEAVTPTITINSPTTGTVIKWTPSVNWATSTLCQYKIDSGSYASLNCASAGADLPRPTAGFHTLSVRGTNILGSITEKVISFTYDNVSPVDTDCTTPLDEATREYYYFLGNVTGICNITANTTLKGMGFTLTGEINAKGLTTGANGHNISLQNITVTGTTTSNGADGAPGINGGHAGNISIANSSTGIITASGGDPQQNGGDGGTVTVTDSFALTENTPVLAVGGDSTGCGYGGSGGDVNLTNTSGYIVVNSEGADAIPQNCTPTGGHSGHQGNTNTAGVYHPPGWTAPAPTVTVARTGGGGSVNPVFAPFFFGRPNSNLFIPVASVKPLNLTALPVFGGTLKNAFSFEPIISDFLFSPLYFYSTQFSKYLASVGFATPQDLMLLNTKPVLLTIPTKNINIPDGLLMPSLSDGTPISIYATRQLGQLPTESATVTAFTTVTVSMYPTTKGTVTASFNGTKYTFKKLGKTSLLSITITTPAKAGNYTLTASGAPLSLVFTVVPPKPVTPTVDKVKKQSVWSVLKFW